MSNTLPQNGPIILASASQIRLALLRAAGLDVTQNPARVNESDMRAEDLAKGLGPAPIASRLARAKALDVSQRCSGALVIGADQVLFCDGRLFEKPRDRAGARAALAALSGRSHELLSAAALVLDGKIVWETVSRAVLRMRPLSAAFIDAYLAAAGQSVLSSVGAYALESHGAQLFEDVEGDYFAILGLPLLPLLTALRERGFIAV